MTEPNPRDYLRSNDASDGTLAVLLAHRFVGFRSTTGVLRASEDGGARNVRDDMMGYESLTTLIKQNGMSTPSEMPAEDYYRQINALLMTAAEALMLTAGAP